MADEKKSQDPKDPREAPAKKPAPKPAHDDEVIGKVYDGRLMRRLLTYLRPYKLQTTFPASSSCSKLPAM
jgi:ATP-binding cassette subfamily B protein